jgi:glycosyltransferase involved in cell wall biosynthesis
MYPLSIVRNLSIEKWFYIDMTLRQLFDFYGADLDNRTTTDAMQRESDGYHAAQGILTLSRWAADSVIRDYGIPPAKVRAVVPGANVDRDIYSHWFSQTPYRPILSEQPLRLVFTGKYWRRKGLDRLMGGFQIARARGANLTLRIIGVDRESAPNVYRTASGVEWKAFLDKRVSALEFLDAVSECNVGCLLSRADASPIAVREYCALGLVTLCTNAGGSSEMAVPGASISVPVDASNESIAETLLRLCEKRSSFERMAEEAWRHRREALWDTTVTRMLNLMQTASGGCGCGGQLGAADC